MNINILKKMNKVPSGLIITPLLVAVLINTFAPQVLSIGGPTAALFKVDSSAMVGVFLLICGTPVNIRQAGLPLYKGVVLLFLRRLAGTLAMWAAGTLFSPNGFLGIPTLVLIACLTSSNSSLYIALCSNYNDTSDAGAISVFRIKDDLPIAMMVPDVNGLTNIPFAALLLMLIPLLADILWGNLGERFKQLYTMAQPLVIITMSLVIGANSSINTMSTAGLSGILSGIISTLIGIVFYFIYNLFLKKKSALGVVLGTTAASLALMPAIVAQADPSLATYMDAATAQLTTAGIITMITVPILVAWSDKRLEKRAPVVEPLKDAKSEKSVILSSPAAKEHR